MAFREQKIGWETFTIPGRTDTSFGFSDGTWYSDKARDGSSMEEYLNWLSEKLIAVN
jgi:hypothetical protein